MQNPSELADKMTKEKQIAFISLNKMIFARVHVRWRFNIMNQLFGKSYVL